MTMRMKIALTVISVVSLIGTVWYISSLNETARLAETNTRIAITDSLVKVRLRIIDSIQSAFKAETVHVTKTRIEYRTLIDSFTQFDTIPLTKRETVIVQAADNAIRACTLALNSCSILQHQKDSVILSKNEIISQYQKQQPSFVRKNSERLIIFLAGMGLSRIIR